MIYFKKGATATAEPVIIPGHKTNIITTVDLAKHINSRIKIAGFVDTKTECRTQFMKP